MPHQPNHVVGTGGYKPGAKVPTNIAAPATIPSNIQDYNKVLASLGLPVAIGTAGSVAAPATVSILNNLSPSQLTELGRLLKKMGYSVKENQGSIRNLFLTEPELVATAENAIRSGGTGSSLLNELKKMYIPLGSSGEENLPSRTITKQDPLVLGEIIDKSYQTKYLRKATAEEKARHIADFKDSIEKGTLTTTKKVKNPKTGKLENVTTVESDFSQNKMTTSIDKKLETENPEDFDRATRIGFNNFLTQNVGGGELSA